MTPRRMVWRAAWAYLALALLLAPMLGLMHGVVHGGGAAPHTVQLTSPAGVADSAAHAHGGAHGWLADLFAVHADASDCRVYDSLCRSDGVVKAPALVLPLLLVAFVFHFLEGEVLARRAALFEARGPPLTR